MHNFLQKVVHISDFICIFAADSAYNNDKHFLKTNKIMGRLTLSRGIWGLLAWLLLAPIPALAEEPEDKPENNLILFNKLPDGRDSLLNQVEFLELSLEKWQWQENMLFVFEDSIHILRPEEALAVRCNKKYYVSSKVFLPDGTVKQLFMERTNYGRNGRPSIFKLYRSEESPLYFMHNQDSILVAIAFRPKAAGPEDIFRQHLLADNQKAGGSPEIAEYIRHKTYPVRGSIRETYELIKSQNPNRMPRVRLGGGIGLFYNETQAEVYTTLNNDDVCLLFEPEKQLQATPMLFADYQTITGLSLRAELAFHKVSMHRMFNVKGFSPLEIAYNHASLIMPYLLRYTFVQCRGRLLPFVEGGAQANIPLKSKYEVCDFVTDEMGYVRGSETSVDKTSLFFLQFPVGAGLEYRFSQRHSLYWSVRFIGKGDYFNRSTGIISNGQSWATSIYFSL